MLQTWKIENFAGNALPWVVIKTIASPLSALVFVNTWCILDLLQWNKRLYTNIYTYNRDKAVSTAKGIGNRSVFMEIKVTEQL